MALPAPPFPPGLASDPTLFLGIWLAGDPDVAELPAGFAVADKSAITVDGAAGVYFASTARLQATAGEGDVFKVFPSRYPDRALSRNLILADACQRSGRSSHRPCRQACGGEGAGLQVSDGRNPVSALNPVGRNRLAAIHEHRMVESAT